MADANITRCVFLTFSSANFPSQVICQRKKLRTQQILEQRFSSKSFRICFFGRHSIFKPDCLAERLWCKTASLLFIKLTVLKFCHQGPINPYDLTVLQQRQHSSIILIRRKGCELIERDSSFKIDKTSRSKDLKLTV